MSKFYAVTILRSLMECTQILSSPGDPVGGRVYILRCFNTYTKTM